MKIFITIMKYISLTALIVNTFFLALCIYSDGRILLIISSICNEITFAFYTAIWDMWLEDLKYE